VKAMILGALLFVLAVGCATGDVRLREQDKSLNLIRTTIQNMMAPRPRVISQNLREYTSQYFSRKDEANFDPQSSSERAFATFVILGDRRPYNVDITVFVERKQGARYAQVGTDKKLAQELLIELKTRLHQSQEDRNLIDGFRAF
jgi:hypothetical protein